MNACLTLAFQCAGREVTTIEGVAEDGRLPPVHAAFIKHDAFQCGYCTPGRIVSAVACIAEEHAGSEAEVREWMTGNICRGAAYPQIAAGVGSCRPRKAGMINFDYAVAKRIDDAFAADGEAKMPIAGGTELLNWFRLGIASPDRVIDIGRLKGLDAIERHGDQIETETLATLNEVGEHPLVREHAAVLGEACLAATP